MGKLIFVTALSLLYSATPLVADDFGQEWYCGDLIKRNERITRAWYRKKDSDSTVPAAPAPKPPTHRLVDTPLVGIWLYTDKVNYVEFDEMGRRHKADEFQAVSRGACEITSRAHNRISRIACRTQEATVSCLVGADTLECDLYQRRNDSNRFRPVVRMVPSAQGGFKAWIPTRVWRDRYTY